MKKTFKDFMKEIVEDIKFLLLTGTSTIGFMSVYGMIWIKLGLPMEWYAIVLPFVLGLLSEFVLCYWIYEG